MAQSINLILLEREQVGVDDLGHAVSGHENHQDVVNHFLEALVIGAAACAVFIVLVVKFLALFH